MIEKIKEVSESTASNGAIKFYLVYIFSEVKDRDVIVAKMGISTISYYKYLNELIKLGFITEYSA